MLNRRKVGMTSSPHGPYDQGYIRATMTGTKSCDTVWWSKSLKGCPWSDWCLQLDSMKSVSRVIADLHAALNTFSCFVHTARLTTGFDWSLSS